MFIRYGKNFRKLNYDINIRNILVNTNFIKELLDSLKDSGKYLIIN